MTILLQLSPDVEARLTAQARQAGMPVTDFVQRAVENLAQPLEFDLDTFLTLPRPEQDRILAEAVADAAPRYAADLALPPALRELTALTALDGEAFHDDL